jgi:hypothetical protein
VRLGGFALLPRMLDKCRATIAGKQGEYHYNCPNDQLGEQYQEPGTFTKIEQFRMEPSVVAARLPPDSPRFLCIRRRGVLKLIQPRCSDGVVGRDSLAEGVPKVFAGGWREIV